ncbi:MAG: 50S ribosomal protein L11 methyltransferase, partial [Phycisphaerales bacterium]|nr:50S ribosomal protein L11 methyltransferase [Phycisphaerales bacterium]
GIPGAADAHNLRGVALRQLGRLAEAAESFGLAVRHAPEVPELHCNLGLALKRIGRVSQAVPHLRFAATRASHLLQAAQHLQQSYQALVPRWHFTMLHDRPRNDAYEQALRSVVCPGQRVLDIGTGSGLLAMMAARAGAAEVVACEAVPLIAEKAREILAANGLADRVRVVAKPSTRLVPGTDLDGPADVLVTEIFDAALIGEGALATFEDAWARLLKADATVIPCAATIRAQLVESPDLRATLTVDR